MDGTRGEKPEIIRDVLAELNFDKDKHTVVMIGDRKHDVHGANHHQIKCIGVSYGYAEDNELKEAGAAHVVHHPIELLALL